MGSRRRNGTTDYTTRTVKARGGALGGAVGGRGMMMMRMMRMRMLRRVLGGRGGEGGGWRNDHLSYTFPNGLPNDFHEIGLGFAGAGTC